MFKPLALTFVLTGSVCLLTGCGGGNVPSPKLERVGATSPKMETVAPTQRVTLHVPDMTDRQGLT